MLKYHGNLQPGGDASTKVTGLAFSGNSKKLALACADKCVYLHDESGERRDKIPTRGADKVNTNYAVRGVDFSPDGAILAVAQSDGLVVGYKIGTAWGEKKAICSKIPTGAPPTTLVWPRHSLHELFFGCADGTVKVGYLKTHKAPTLYSGPGCVVALANEGRAGKLLVSGHLDGSLLLYNGESQTFKKIYSCGFAPFALDFGKHIACAGRGAVLFLDRKGNLLQRFDGAGEFEAAAANAAGDTFAFAGPAGVAVFALNSKRSEWEKAGEVLVEDFLGCRAAMWRPDGARLVVASLGGSVDFFDLVLRRLRVKGKFDLNYVSASKVRVVDADKQVESIVESARGLEITRLDVQGDRFVVATTPKTLIVGELQGALSEVEWSGASQPKVEFGHGVAWAALAGEVSVVELGKHEVAAVFRTEFAKKAVVSASARGSRKFVAYLLDLQTINVLRLSSRVSECTVEHDARVVGLQLNARATKVLFKDAQKRLFLFDLARREKVSLLPCCGFWAWVPDSDVVVAQAGGALSVWYAADSPDKRAEIPVRGTATAVRCGADIGVAVAEGAGEHFVPLDPLLVRFGFALESRDVCACAQILEGRRDAQHPGQWAALLALALEERRLVVAERCYAALGDAPKAAFARKTNRIARAAKARGESGLGVEAEARLLMLEGQFAKAESLLLAREEAEKVVEMYQSVHRWEDALRVAERFRAADFEALKAEYAKWLVDSGQLEKAAELKQADGQRREAAELFLAAGLPARAAALALALRLAPDDPLASQTMAALLKDENWEKLGEAYERFGDVQRAVGLFARAGAFSKAVELARAHAPELVVGLEEKWGDHLVGENQREAAVGHFVEARQPAKAVDAAIGARAWSRAAQLLNALAPEDADRYCLRIAEQLERSRQYELAEKYYVKAKKAARGFAMWVGQARLREARKFAAEQFRPEEVAEQWAAAGRAAEKDKKFDEAEKLFLEAGRPELAIKMHKAAGQWERMLRLFALHRPENLKDAHVLVGRRLEEEEQLARAEKHFVEAGAWPLAVDMHEKRRGFEDCLRLLKNHGSERDAVERLQRWESAVGPGELVAMLKRLGLKDVLVDYLAERRQFAEAFEEAPQHKKADVHLAYAMHLEDQKNAKEAEKHYVLAGKFEQAVQMHVEWGDFHAAESLARQHDSSLLADLLLQQANQHCAAGEFDKMEIAFIRGKKPELAAKAYLAAGRFAEASRVARLHCPHLLKEVNAQLGASDDPLRRAKLLDEGREHEAAIDSYLAVLPGAAPRPEVEAAWERALQLALNFAKPRFVDVTRVVCKRLRDAGSLALAAEYYETAGLFEEAVRCFLQAGLFEQAKAALRGVAGDARAELQTQFDQAFKASLKARGEAEQLVGQNEVREGLELMAERGDWTQALGVARASSSALFAHFFARFLRESMDAGKFGEALSAAAKFGLPQVAAHLPLYVRLVDETFALCEPNEVADLRAVLAQFVQHFDAAVFDEKVRAEFERFLFLSHLLRLKHVYESHKLRPLLVATARALLRFVDLTNMDKPFYEAGKLHREAGDELQAFVFLNRYLDVYELIEDPKNELEDNAEFRKTDIPDLRRLRVPQTNLVSPEERRAIRDWLLKVSVARGAQIRLPTKQCAACSQDIYAGCVTCPFCQHKYPACFLTGEPLDAAGAKECRACLKLFDAAALKLYKGSFGHCAWCNASFADA